MEQLDHILSSIASQRLGISTLKTRRSDRLDFYDLSVWRIKEALSAAFEAGRQSQHIPAEPIADMPTLFDNYEIQPCRRYYDADEPDMAFVETCAPFEASFWTVYGHIPGEGVQAIGDFDTREHAEEVYARITGERYR